MKNYMKFHKKYEKKSADRKLLSKLNGAQVWDFQPIFLHQ